jgi:hypothetical protein
MAWTDYCAGDVMSELNFAIWKSAERRSPSGQQYWLASDILRILQIPDWPSLNLKIRDAQVALDAAGVVGRHIARMHNDAGRGDTWLTYRGVRALLDQFVDPFNANLALAKEFFGMPTHEDVYSRAEVRDRMNRLDREGVGFYPELRHQPRNIQPAPGAIDNGTREIFDSLKHVDEHGEWWSARELMEPLGYAKNVWHNFTNVIDKARASCENCGASSSDHFYDAVKVISAGKGAQQQIVDFRLSRFAAYQVAMNSDPRKPAVARAQQYFAVMTRMAETGQAPQSTALAAVETAEVVQSLITPVLELIKGQQSLIASIVESTDALRARLERLEGAEQIRHQALMPPEQAQPVDLRGQCRIGQRKIKHLSNCTDREAWNLIYHRFELATRMKLKPRLQRFRVGKRKNAPTLDYIQSIGKLDVLYKVIYQFVQELEGQKRN